MNHSLTNPARTLNSALAGDEAAFAQLRAATVNQVYYVTRQILKNEADIEDCIQETYLKIYQNLGQLEDAEKLQSWANRIAINCAKDILKKKNPLLFSEALEEDESAEEKFGLESSDRLEQPQESLDLSETQKIVQQIIDSLPEEQRLCVTMRYFQNMKIGDIAAELGVSDNTVKSRLRYAEKKIKAEVLNYEKQGVSLHSLSPLAFFIYVFQNGSAVCAAPAALVGTAGGAAVGVAAGSAAAATAVTSHLAIKITAIVLAVSLAVGGGVIGYKKLAKKQTTAPTTTLSAQQQQELENKKLLKSYHWSTKGVNPEIADITYLRSAADGYDDNDMRAVRLKSGYCTLMKRDGQLIDTGGLNLTDFGYAYNHYTLYNRDSDSEYPFPNLEQIYEYDEESDSLKKSGVGGSAEAHRKDRAAIRYGGGKIQLLYLAGPETYGGEFPGTYGLDHWHQLSSKEDVIAYFNNFSHVDTSKIRYIKVFLDKSKDNTGSSPKSADYEQYALFDLDLWQPVTDFIYEDILFNHEVSYVQEYGISNAIALVGKDNVSYFNVKTGKIGKTYSYQLEYNIDNIYAFSAKGLVPVRQNDRWSVIDLSEKTIVKPIFEKIVPSADEGTFWAKYEGKWGRISIQ